MRILKTIAAISLLCSVAVADRYWVGPVPWATDHSDLPPSTTISESFDTAESGTLGPDLTWTEIAGDQDVVSNACELVTNDATIGPMARADSDLSSTDHYAQVTLLNPASAAGVWDIGACARKDSSATKTFYKCDWVSNSGVQSWRTMKAVSNTITIIGSSTSASASNNDVLKIECSGTSISRYKNGALQNTATDSAISSGLRCGVGTYWTTGTKPRLDAFQAADLSATPNNFPQVIFSRCVPRSPSRRLLQPYWAIAP